MTRFDLTLLLLLSNSAECHDRAGCFAHGRSDCRHSLLIVNGRVGPGSGTSRGFRRVVQGDPGLLTPCRMTRAPSVA
jgi:hypothetical protein